MNSSVGSCTLVGAGPGDPDLLTIAAVKAIAAATVLLVDDLVNEAVLQYASSSARVIHVGKRGGCRSTPQAFIERLMIMAAQEGEQVVRLKGGDPLIFGRGGEELEHLGAAGVPVRVIQGITAGVAAAGALNVSLTHREHAHGVVFVTGHAKPGGDGPDWGRLAVCAQQARLTLVIYMGIALLPEIVQGLLQGLPATTPAAVVQYASLPQQRQMVCQLGGLVEACAVQEFGSPSVVIVGDVLRGAQCLAASSGDARVGPFQVAA